MQPVTADIVIARPREEVFDYLADIANHSEFCDHFMKQWHLTRLVSSGRGAGARFRYDVPFQRFDWGDLTIVQAERPHKLVAVGRYGKFNRIKTYAEWTLDPAGSGTRVTHMFETEPALPTDRIVEAFGQRGYFKRSAAKALRRLRAILEDGEGGGQRVTVAGHSHPAV